MSGGGWSRLLALVWGVSNLQRALPLAQSGGAVSYTRDMGSIPLPADLGSYDPPAGSAVAAFEQSACGLWCLPPLGASGNGLEPSHSLGESSGEVSIQRLGGCPERGGEMFPPNSNRDAPFVCVPPSARAERGRRVVRAGARAER